MLFQLFLLILVSGLGGAFEELYRHDQQAIHLGTLILTMDRPSNYLPYQLKFQQALCEMASKIRFAAAYLITINETEYRVESFCWLKNSSLDQSYQLGVHPYQEPDDSRNRPHFAALGKALELITASDTGDLNLVILVSHMSDSCEFFECDSGSDNCPECSCPTRKCYTLYRMGRSYVDQLNHQITRLVAHNTTVVIFGLLWNSFATEAQWTNKSIFWKIRDYGNLSEDGLKHLRGVMDTIEAKANHSMQQMRTSTVTAETGIRTSELGASLVPAVSGTTSESAINVSIKGNNIEDGSSQIEWWMILLICGLALIVIMFIGFGIFFAARANYKTATPHPDEVSALNEFLTVDKRRSTEPRSPSALSKSVEANLTGPFYPRMSSCSVSSLVSFTHDETETLPTYMKEKEHTMSPNVDRRSSQFPSELTMPDI